VLSLSAPLANIKRERKMCVYNRHNCDDIVRHLHEDYAEEKDDTALVVSEQEHREYLSCSRFRDVAADRQPSGQR